MRPVGDPWQGRREFAAGWGPEDPGRGPNNHLRWPLARAPSYARWVGARGPWVWTREPPSVAPGKGTVDLLPLADFRTRRLKIGEVGKRICRLCSRRAGRSLQSRPYVAKVSFFSGNRWYHWRRDEDLASSYLSSPRRRLADVTGRCDAEPI